MGDPTTFAGIPAEGLAFLSNLADNNNREWFEAHKQDYKDYLLAPTVDFVAALGDRLQTISDGIIYDTRANGSGSLMRIYRDIRFSKDKTPYKTHLGMVFWEGLRKKTESPGFFVDLRADGIQIYGGDHMFPKPVLAAYREAVDDAKQGAALEKAIADLQGGGIYEVGGDEYKRVPSGYDTDHPRADLLRYKGLFVKAPHIDTATVSSPGVVEACYAHCAAMADLHHWLVRVDQRAA